MRNTGNKADEIDNYESSNDDIGVQNDLKCGQQLPRTPQFRRVSVDANELLHRQDVLDFVQTVNDEIAEILDGTTLPSPRTVRLSVCSPVPTCQRHCGFDGQILFSPLNQMRRLGKNSKSNRGTEGRMNTRDKAPSNYARRKRTASTEEALAALAASIKHQVMKSIKY